MIVFSLSLYISDCNTFRKYFLIICSQLDVLVNMTILIYILIFG